MKLKLIIGIIIWLIVNPVSAQVTYSKPDEFSSIKKRTLIVELLEVNKKQIEKWKKKKSKTKKPKVSREYGNMILEYENFVKDYNSYIKAAVEKYWDFNSNIEYKTYTEVKKLRKSSKKYTVLWYSESGSQTADEYGHKYFPDLTIPTLNYSRIEKGTRKVDYSFFMPNTGERKKNEIRLSDIIISLKLMKNQINQIEKIGKKRYIFKSYAKDQAKENCNKLSGKKLYINELTIHKNTSIGQIKSAYKAGTVEKISDEEVSKAIENEEDYIIGFAIPYQIATGSVGPFSSAQIIFLKSFINVKTGKIYTYYGTSMGDFTDPFFRRKDFSKFGKCD